jgi:putative transposase
VAVDLKTICQAATVTDAIRALEKFKIKCDKKYPVISRSWRDNLARVKPMFELPAEIRRVVYTTYVTPVAQLQIKKDHQGAERLPE